MKSVAQNRRARFDYELLETVEAGIILTGAEVKSCRSGHVHLAGSYVTMQNNRAFVRNMNIAPYRYTSDASYEPLRNRELLLKKSERERLSAAASQKGITIIPLEVRAGKYIKVVLGLGRGRKKLDKRAAIKKREVERKIREGREY